MFSTMFYQESKINKILKCQRCQKGLDEPRLLPCGNTICNCCIHLIETQQITKFTSEFNCSLCNKAHTMPTEGFPINLAILHLMSEQPDEIYRSEHVETLKSNLKFMKNNLNQLDLDIENGSEKIVDHCIELRRLVQLSTEEKILELNKINETLISQIDDYEKEAIAKFQKETISLPDFFDNKNDIQLFLSETNDYLNSFRIDDKKVNDTNERALQYKKFIGKQMKIFKTLLFNNRIMDFEVSNN